MDVDYTVDTTTVTIQFDGFESHLHGVMMYEWAVGTSPGGEDVQPFMSEGIIHSEEENVAGDGKCHLLLTRFESFMSEGIIHSEEENVAGDGKCRLLLTGVESFMSEGIIHSEEENVAGDGKCHLLLTRLNHS